MPTPTLPAGLSVPPGFTECMEALERINNQYDEPLVQSFMSQFTTLQYLHPNRGRHPGDAYPSNYDLVDALGQGPKIAKFRLPPDVKVMQAQACFENSLRMVHERSDLTYCEGFATTATGLLLVEHAWLEDRTGRIIDPTWAGIHGAGDYGVYYGLRFSTTFTVTHALQTSWTSILEGDIMQNDAKILRFGVITDERGVITGLKERA